MEEQIGGSGGVSVTLLEFDGFIKYCTHFCFMTPSLDVCITQELGPLLLRLSLRDFSELGPLLLHLSQISGVVLALSCYCDTCTDEKQLREERVSLPYSSKVITL